ncbi:MAG: triosephosphate isomerase [Candidatus Levybacteria bacterium]|nr:triosephosphate isomerase [Candidatus Levybacteria bacterium]
MKDALIFANWKSNKTKNDAKNWLEEVSVQIFPQNLEIVILAPFTLLDFISSYIKMNSLLLKVGAQDISPFESGPYTGEVSASQVKEFAEFSLIGHSERRSNFGESNEMIQKKVERAESSGLIPVVCISRISQLESLGSNRDIIIAYEPPFAISTSGPDASPENPDLVSEFVQKIKEKIQSKVIYGGSVDAQNIKEYLSIENVDGVLVGGKSLEPQSFINILKNAV